MVGRRARRGLSADTRGRGAGRHELDAASKGRLDNSDEGNVSRRAGLAHGGCVWSRCTESWTAPA